MNVLFRTSLSCFVLGTFLFVTGVGKPISTAAAKSLEAKFNQKNNRSSNFQKETPKSPQQAYRYALELKKNGYLAQALAKFSEAYGEENILTDSYYDLLDRKRRSILKDIENGSPWFPGDSDKEKVLRSFRTRFKALQSSPNFFAYHLSFKVTAFPLKRFINYEIVQATQKRPTRDCLNSPDPWMVSVVLFLARKGKVNIQPESVIKRWEHRPDLWDDICTENALLYLGTLKPDKLKTLNIGNEDIKMAIQPLIDAAEKSLLFDCASHFNPSRHLLLIDMSVKEAVPYESLRRVEISIRDVHGKEFFRAMNNRSSRCAPIPPNAFGIYPVGKKENLELRDVKSAGHEAQIPVNTRYGNLVPGCKTSNDHGILNIKWQIHPVGWQCPDGKCYIYVKIIPKKSKDSQWQLCSTFTYKANTSTQNSKHVNTNAKALIKPKICLKENYCFEPDKITLIHLSKQTRKGILQRWVGDKAYQYNYKELSRKVIDLKNLPAHKIILEPGFYQFKYNDVRGDPPYGFYGKSEIFEVTAGKEIEVPVWVESAI